MLDAACNIQNIENGDPFECNINLFSIAFLLTVLFNFTRRLTRSIMFVIFWEMRCFASKTFCYLNEHHTADNII